MLSRVSLTAANRPELYPDESLLFVQNNVGLYEGKNKLPNYQNGCAYLTTHRACYVDNQYPKKYSTAVELKDVDRVESYAGFLKSSPKITLHLKANNLSTACTSTGPGSSAHPNGTNSLPGTPTRTASPAITSVTWICPICSFSNPLPSNHTPGVSATPSCLTCGIKPSTKILEAALSAPPKPPPKPTLKQSILDTSDTACPRCTFHNHPSLRSCEICGSPLPTPTSLPPPSNEPTFIIPTPLTTPSTSSFTPTPSQQTATIKFSFRSSGHAPFLSHLRSALIQRKWLLTLAPPIPRPPSPPRTLTPSATSAGIAGLETRIQSSRNRAALTLGSGAFEDLTSLMTHAKDLVALAETFSQKFGTAAGGGGTEAELGMKTLGLVSKEMVSSGGDEEAWICELSRQVAEFLVEGGVLRREGGVMTLVDVFAVLNRARAGIDLISPKDLERAVGKFEGLGLPVRGRKMKSGLWIVRHVGRGEEVVAKEVKTWVETEGKGVSVEECAKRWGWGWGVAREELERVEERGWVCREMGIEGVRFWGNRFLEPGLEQVVERMEELVV